MKQHYKIALITFMLMAIVGWAAAASQGPAASATVPVTITVTVQARHGNTVPAVYREDVRVLQGNDRLQVTEWTPMGDIAPLELMILVDDSLDPGVAQQLQDVRRFINTLGSATQVGVGYISNSNVNIVQNFTIDHAQAAKAVRMPMGLWSVSSPYAAIADLIKAWPDIGHPRVIFMVSNGLDALDPGPTSVYLDRAITRAQRNNIRVFTIFAESRRFYHSFNFGQSHLLQLADETGGEAYFQGSYTPLSFTPYLEDFAGHLNNQYRLTFLAKAEDKPTDQHIKLRTEVPNAELVGPDLVRVPAAK